jgi:hypothetical protein
VRIARPRSSASVLLLDVGAEPVEPALPGAPVVVDPARCVLELGGTELAFAGAPDLRRDDEVDLLEDPDVLPDAVEGETERLCQLADRCRPTRQSLEDAAPCRIREGKNVRSRVEL